jgi:hypothetical protein
MSNESDALLAPPRTLSPVSTASATQHPTPDDNDDDIDSVDHNDRHRAGHAAGGDDDDDRVSVTSTITTARAVRSQHFSLIFFVFIYASLIESQKKKKREEAKGFYCLPYRGPVAQEWRRFVDLAGPLIIGYMSVNAMLTEDLAFVGQVRPFFVVFPG